jgi:hypothetical protein
MVEGELDVTDLSREIRSHGLVEFRGVPDLGNVPVAAWDGDYRRFIEVSAVAGARIVYIEHEAYNGEQLISSLAEEHSDVREWEDEAGAEEGKAWLVERLTEVLAPWEPRTGETFSLRLAWFRDSVAHVWSYRPEWTQAHRIALNAAFDEIEVVDYDDRVRRSTEETLRLQACAEELAMHPRFPEANSQEKREFMAAQLFQHALHSVDGATRFTAGTIAAHASLVYWWNIEPVEWASKTQRVRDLRREGLSVRSIAAALKISEGKVRGALAEEEA